MFRTLKKSLVTAFVTLQVGAIAEATPPNELEDFAVPIVIKAGNLTPEGADAYMKLGVNFIKGQNGYHKNPFLGGFFLQLAAEAGDVNAQANMIAASQITGAKISVAPAELKKYAQYKMSLEDPQTLLRYSRMLARGEFSLREDLVSAKTNLMKLTQCEATAAEAYFELACMLLMRDCLAIPSRYDPFTQGNLYLGMALSMNHWDAYYFYGKQVLEGNSNIKTQTTGVAEEKQYAIKSLMIAAEKGKHVDADLFLAECYLSKKIGESMDDLSRILQGMEHLRSAKSNGSLEASFKLADILMTTKYGIDIKTGNGMQYVQDAADAGYVEAQRYFGAARLNGKIDGICDEAVGLEYMTRAADAGHMSAICDLGVYLLLNEQEVDRALGMIRHAAEADDPYGKFNLGVETIKGGHGITKDPEIGERLIKASLESNDPEILYYAARIYLSGTYGLPQNFEQGLTYLRQSAEGGNEYALEFLEIFEGNNAQQQPQRRQVRRAPRRRPVAAGARQRSEIGRAQQKVQEEAEKRRKEAQKRQTKLRKRQLETDVKESPVTPAWPTEEPDTTNRDARRSAKEKLEKEKERAEAHAGRSKGKKHEAPGGKKEKDGQLEKTADREPYYLEPRDYALFMQLWQPKNATSTYEFKARDLTQYKDDITLSSAQVDKIMGLFGGHIDKARGRGSHSFGDITLSAIMGQNTLHIEGQMFPLEDVQQTRAGVTLSGDRVQPYHVRKLRAALASLGLYPHNVVSVAEGDGLSNAGKGKEMA